MNSGSRARRSSRPGRRTTRSRRRARPRAGRCAAARRRAGCGSGPRSRSPAAPWRDDDQRRGVAVGVEPRGSTRPRPARRPACRDSVATRVSRSPASYVGHQQRPPPIRRRSPWPSGRRPGGWSCPWRRCPRPGSPAAARAPARPAPAARARPARRPSGAAGPAGSSARPAPGPRAATRPSPGDAQLVDPLAGEAEQRRQQRHRRGHHDQDRGDRGQRDAVVVGQAHQEQAHQRDHHGRPGDQRRAAGGGDGLDGRLAGVAAAASAARKRVRISSA